MRIEPKIQSQPFSIRSGKASFLSFFSLIFIHIYRAVAGIYLYGVGHFPAATSSSLMECDWPQTSSFVIRHIIPSRYQLLLTHQIWYRIIGQYQELCAQQKVDKKGRGFMWEKKNEERPKWPLRSSYHITSSLYGYRPAICLLLYSTEQLSLEGGRRL